MHVNRRWRGKMSFKMQQIWVKEFFVTLAKTKEKLKKKMKRYFDIARPFLLELKPVSDIMFDQGKLSKE